jgi:hypothetical protein
MKQELEAAVTFTILMQNVQDKSPGYMLEKWEAVQREEHPRRLLDNNNLAKLKAWMEMWHVKED